MYAYCINDPVNSEDPDGYSGYKIKDYSYAAMLLLLAKGAQRQQAFNRAFFTYKEQ